MIKSFYFFTIGIIFIVVSIFHFLRLMFEWEILISHWLIPGWISGIIIIIALFLAYWSFKMGKKQPEKEENKK